MHASKNGSLRGLVSHVSTAPYSGATIHGAMISRRTFLSTLAAASGSVVLPWTWQPQAAASGLGTPRIANFTPIRRGVGTFQRRGGTVGYLATPDALVVVDTQYPEPARLLWDGLQKRTDRRIDLLLNTHHHGDHTAGNAVLAPHAERFVAHRGSARLQRARAEAQGNADEQAFPATTYDDSARYVVGDEVVTLTHYGAAHTGGDSVIHFEKADVVHMGDLVFNRMPPFIDIDGGASVPGWIGVLEAVHARYSDDTVFIHGHAGTNHSITGTREDLLVMRDFLAGLIQYVEQGLADGKSIDELAGVDRLPEYPNHYLASWENAIPNAIRATHRGLTRE